MASCSSNHHRTSFNKHKDRLGADGSKAGYPCMCKTLSTRTAVSLSRQPKRVGLVIFNRHECRSWPIQHMKLVQMRLVRMDLCAWLEHEDRSIS